MKIALIGAGNVATCLGPRLKEAGHEITAVYSRTVESACVLADRLGVTYTTDLKAVPASDAAIVMLKDDALKELAPAIAGSLKGALLLHAAGSVPMDIWREAGAIRYGVLYPMQTFSKESRIDWNQVPLFIEGSSDQTLESIRQLALTISPDVTPLSSEGRKKLHLAAVFTCNFSNHMYAIAEQLLASEGVPFRVMLPLVRETARKVESIKPHDAQTGPAIRGDRKVIEEHLALLKDNPEYAELYRLISIDINKNLK
jgi:predicted short-subunit dehydrogenase-like oxidoreductase (DUF2520 family)